MDYNSLEVPFKPYTLYWTWTYAKWPALAEVCAVWVLLVIVCFHRSFSCNPAVQCCFRRWLDTVPVLQTIDVKNVFLRFFIQGTFLRFFILPTFFIFKNVHWKYHLKLYSVDRLGLVQWQIITASFPSTYTSRHAWESSSSSSKNSFRRHNVNH